MPLVKPLTTVDVAPEIVAVAAPGEAVTVYDVIAEPPLLAGATHDTVADVLPATAVTDVGAPGTVGALGVTGDEAADGAPVPTLFAAVTTNVYAVPLVKPLTTTDVAPEIVAVAPPGVAVAVYEVIGEPPLFEGATHDTVAAPFPATAVTAVGAPGTVGADARRTNIPAMYAPDGDRPDVVIVGAVAPADWK